MTQAQDEKRATRVDAAEQDAVAFGEKLGRDFSNIWSPTESLVAALLVPIRAHTAKLVGKVGEDSRMAATHAIVTVTFFLGLGLFIGFCVEANKANPEFEPTNEAASSTSGVLLGFWLLVSVLWFIGLIVAYRTNVSVKAKLASRQRKLNEVATHAAFRVISERKTEARLHEPAATLDPAVPFRPSGRMPAPQPYGVSHRGAEQLCAEWMRYLGQADAQVTQFTGDGGIDVTSNHYIAQVKNYTGTVGVAEVREMAGVVAGDGRKPLFFTSGTYAAGSVEFANKVMMPLFVYDAVAGTLKGANPLAERIFSTGL